jgi:hypothetical protein
MPRKSAKTAALEAENARLRAELAAAKEGTEIVSEISVTAPVISGSDRAPSSGTVTVACKIPQGIRLQLQHKQTTKIPSGRGGEYTFDEQWVFGGPVYHVFGPSTPVGHVDNYILPHKIEGGYAFTRGIPAAFWEQWLEQNKKAPYVENNMIFAHREAEVSAIAKDLKQTRSGLEPLSREVDKDGRLKDPRLPKPVSSANARIFEAHSEEG